MRHLSRKIISLLLVAGALGTMTTPSAAQPAAAAEQVVPPRLLRSEAATWPVGIEPGDPVTVRLVLTIGVDGHVTDSVILESSGEQFDAAARAAVETFEFEPARRSGQPIAVKVQYDYVVRPPEPEPAVDGAGGPSAPAESQAPAAPPPEAAPAEPIAERGLGAVPSTTGAGPAAPDDEGFGAVAQIEAPPREVTRRAVSGEELTKIPGTSGDAMRAIEVMPGVARTTSDDGDPIIRGAAWNETRTFVQGTTVPYIYHFGGVKSAFNSHLLDRVEMYPGNFSVRYGRAVGGIIDARVREPRTDAFHGILELSVLDSMALVEAPVTDQTSFAVAARRSNIDFVFENFVPDDAYNVVAAPLYWDYQAVVHHEIRPHHRLQLMAQGSHDSMRLIFSDPNQFDPALRGKVEVSSEYHFVQANLDSDLGAGVEQRLQLAAGTFDGIERLGPLAADFHFQVVASRGEWGLHLGERARLNLGYDVEGTVLHGKYAGPAPSQAEGDVNDEQRLGTIDLVRIEDTIGVIQPAVYAEAELRPADRLLLVPGVRLDYFSELDALSVDPRLSARYEAGDRTALKWGVGVFSQPPIYWESLRDLGNPELDPLHALHTSVGIEQRWSEHFELGVEGFYKRLTHRVVATEGSQPPRFINDGVGRIYGVELSARWKTEHTFAYLAYTLARSERRDRNEDWRLFENDQPHILALTASQDLGHHWELGGRFRLVSGNPYTAVTGAVYDASVDGYLPLYGRPFGERNPAFHQLDVRIEKGWELKHWKLSTYLDVQNVYNAQNQEGIDYSFDYTRRETYTGLPITPNLGVRGEL